MKVVTKEHMRSQEQLCCWVLGFDRGEEETNEENGSWVDGWDLSGLFLELQVDEG